MTNEAETGSELLRKAFRLLSEPGASVIIKVLGSVSDYRVRHGSGDAPFESIHNDGTWSAWWCNTSCWLSVEPCREPRVFEFEADSDTEPPADLAHAMCKGSRFRARFEEILEDQ